MVEIGGIADDIVSGAPKELFGGRLG